jgi:hypothetical protein
MQTISLQIALLLPTNHDAAADADADASLFSKTQTTPIQRKSGTKRYDDCIGAGQRWL